MAELYFAYGSNLVQSRMRERAPSARVVGTAHLPDRRLALNKLGRDGSPKANLEPAPSGHVWGVVWSLPEEGWAELDRAEAGYERIAVAVDRGGASLAAETYRSGRLTASRELRADYKRWIVEGAREHGLPADWIRLLEALPGGQA